MPCNHEEKYKLVKDQLDGKLSPERQVQLEEHLEHCRHCREVLDQASMFQNHANQWQQQTPPPWNRSVFSPRLQRYPFTWLNWVSACCSVLALALVLVYTRTPNQAPQSLATDSAMAREEVASFIAREVAAARAEDIRTIESLLQIQAQDLLSAQRYNQSRLLEQIRLERRDDVNAVYTSWMNQRAIDRNITQRNLENLADYQMDNREYLNNLVRSVSTSTVR